MMENLILKWLQVVKLSYNMGIQSLDPAYKMENKCSSVADLLDIYSF